MPWPIFPGCPNFNFTSVPDYDVTIVERASGRRTVNRNWYYPLHLYTSVQVGDRPEDDIQRVLRFWHSIGGQSGRFLFKDYNDYKSSLSAATPVTAVDMPLAETTDSPPALQMIKTYTDEEFMFTQQRIIQKPRLGTVVVAANGVPMVSGFTVDYETGLVTIDAYNPLVTYTWGGEFWVPCMFESKPQFVITNKSGASMFIGSTDFSVRELRLDEEDLA